MEPKGIPPATEGDLAEDRLEGAAAIAQFLYRSASRRHLRKVYYLAERSRLPVFRLGSTLCARKSVLLKFITDQEERSLPATAASPQAPNTSDGGLSYATTSSPDEAADVAALLSTCSICGARRDLPTD